MKKIVVMLAMVCTLLSGCRTTGSDAVSFLSFSLRGEETSVQHLFINETTDRLELDASLTVKGGAVSLQMIDEDSSAVIWENQYTESADFQIILNDLAAGANLSIVVQASCEHMELEIAAPIKLVENREKPEKPARP